MIRHNFRYKLLAVSIALVLWFYVNKGYNPNVTKELSGVPLIARKVESGLIVTGKPRTIRVVLEGPREHVNAVAADPEEILVHVNLRGKGPGKHKSPVIITPPQGYAGLVRATAVPHEVVVTIVREARRVMRAEVEFAGTPPVGFRFGPPEFTPAKAVASGIPTLISRISRLTVTVEPDQLREGVIEGDFELSPRDRDGREMRGLALNPENVHLRLSLEKAPATRVVFVSPSILGRPPFPYRVSDIEVQPQTVAITGRPEQLLQISTVGTQVLDLSGRTATFSQRLRIAPPSGTSLADGRYVRITVRIVSTPAETPGSEPANPGQ